MSHRESCKKKGQWSKERWGDGGKWEKQGRVGGTVSARAALLFSAPYLRGWFAFIIVFPLFAWQMCTPTYPHPNKLSPPFLSVLHLPGRGISTTIKQSLAASCCYHDHKTTIDNECSRLHTVFATLHLLETFGDKTVISYSHTSVWKNVKKETSDKVTWDTVINYHICTYRRCAKLHMCPVDSKNSVLHIFLETLLPLLLWVLLFGPWNI